VGGETKGQEWQEDHGIQSTAKGKTVGNWSQEEQEERDDSFILRLWQKILQEKAVETTDQKEEKREKSNRPNKPAGYSGFIATIKELR
jgi:hypothetical protein